MKLLGPIVVLFLIFGRISIVFFIIVLSSCLFVNVSVLVIATLKDLRWYFTVVFVCMSLTLIEKLKCWLTYSAIKMYSLF